ncbi:MAG: HD family hydrolase [Sandaracinus sp.]|nr:HD family hydrolase [Sandaracinus sp.]
MNAKELVDAAMALDAMTDLPRTGWVMRGVAAPETLAAHSFGVAWVTALLVDALRAEGETVDGEKALRMALVHDAPEAALGDVPMPVKTPALDAALGEVERELARRLLPPSFAADYEEMEAGETLEARIVRAADKLQLVLRLHRYELQRRGQLDELWQSPGNFRDRGLRLVKEAFDEVLRRAGRTRP